MHYGNIKPFSIENGTGVRVSLFVSGCRNHCDQCFSQQTWDFSYGREFTQEVQQRIVEMLSPSYIAGLTILGGEPFEPENQRELLPFLRMIREKCPDKTIWMYSGFTFEEMTGQRGECRAHVEENIEILKLIDVLVDGRFVQAQKNLSLAFRGSENQRIIDMPKTLECGEVTWVEL